MSVSYLKRNLSLSFLSKLQRHSSRRCASLSVTGECVCTSLQDICVTSRRPAYSPVGEDDVKVTSKGTDQILPSWSKFLQCHYKNAFLVLDLSRLPLSTVCFLYFDFFLTSRLTDLLHNILSLLFLLIPLLFYILLGKLLLCPLISLFFASCQ